MSAIKDNDYDVAIIGGGMVGAALACSLAQAGVSVCVLEAHHPVAPPDDQYDRRVSALTLASVDLFESLSVWRSMRDRCSPIRAMHVWDEGGSGDIVMDSADIAKPALGYIVENSVIMSALMMRIKELDHIDYRCPVEVANIDISGREWREVQLANGSSIRARLVVGADGGASRVRTWMQVAVRTWSFEQQAIVATVRTERPHEDIARQHFLQTGPLAFLPLMGPHDSSIVWSADSGVAEALLALDDQAFIEALATAFGDELGGIEAISGRAGFPLIAIHAEHYIAERVVLVGDAAHRIHPLAGQGLNLGLADIAMLHDCIKAARLAGRDIGSMRVLRQYERARHGANGAMLFAMDSIKRLFGARSPMIKGLRNLGIDMADAIGPLKGMLMRYAAGRSGKI